MKALLFRVLSRSEAQLEARGSVRGIFVTSPSTRNFGGPVTTGYNVGKFKQS